MSGIDPYAAAVSDVYQDMFGEGSYAGKGIYEVDPFEAAVADRVLDSTLLSHDLFEGVAQQRRVQKHGRRLRPQRGRPRRCPCQHKSLHRTYPVHVGHGGGIRVDAVMPEKNSLEERSIVADRHDA